MVSVGALHIPHIIFCTGLVGGKEISGGVIDGLKYFCNVTVNLYSPT